MLSGLAVCLLGGCRPASDTSDRKPSLQIETFRARIDSVPNRMGFIGYLSSNFDAVIQPRVNGFLASRHFSSGMPVRRGQLLFRIDPEQLSTSMLAAEAQLESARAQAVEARNNYERAVPLARINAISQSQLDQYTAQYRAAEAAVRSAEQALRNASLNVGYTELRSPIDGIAAHAEAHVGDYVGPGTQFNVLTTVSNTDTVSVDVAIPMSQYLRIAGNRTPLADNGGAVVGYPPDAGRRNALSPAGMLQLHAARRLQYGGDHRPCRGFPQSRRAPQTRAVRPRGGQRRPGASVRRRAAAVRFAVAEPRLGMGRR